jgi:hypothetical protein
MAEIKAIYWLRWKVETNFGKMKMNIIPIRFRSKKINTLMTDLACVRFIEILSSFIEYQCNCTIKYNFKINSAACIDMLYDKILKLVFFNNLFKREVGRLVKILFKNLIEIVPDRTFDHCNYWPPKKWGRNGNRYKRAVEEE